MPISHEIFEDQRVLCARYSGVIEFQDVVRFLAEFERSARKHPRFNEFADMSAVEEIRLDAREMKTVFEMMEDAYRRNREAKRVAIFEPHTVSAMMTSLFCLYIRQRYPMVRAECFTSKEKACAFIGLDPER